MQEDSLSVLVYVYMREKVSAECEGRIIHQIFDYSIPSSPS